MNTKELAKLLNGREYLQEMTGAECIKAKESGIVVMFGYSDDNVEIRGKIDEEIAAWNGTTIYLTCKGLVVNLCDSEDCPYFEKEKNSAVKIKAIWDSGGYSWIFEAPFRHETFDVMEDGIKFCRGIIFYLSDVPKGVRND